MLLIMKKLQKNIRRYINHLKIWFKSKKNNFKIRILEYKKRILKYKIVSLKYKSYFKEKNRQINSAKSIKRKRSSSSAKKSKYSHAQNVLNTGNISKCRMNSAKKKLLNTHLI
jgi:hypothetical protein